MLTKRATICGRNRETDCSGTPKHISMHKIAQLVGCLKIATADLKLNFSLTIEDESIAMRWYARSFSS